MRHGDIILKLNKWSWDNWVIYGIKMLMAVTVCYGLGMMIADIDDCPDFARRRNEVEAIVEERERREEEEAKHTCVDIDYEEHPELNPELSAPSEPKYTRVIRSLDTVTVAY